MALKAFVVQGCGAALDELSRHVSFRLKTAVLADLLGTLRRRSSGWRMPRVFTAPRRRNASVSVSSRPAMGSGRRIAEYEIQADPVRGSPARTWRRTAPSGVTSWRDAPACAVCRRIALGVIGTVGSRSSATPRGSPCTGRFSRFRKWACSSAAPALPGRLSSRWLIAPVQRLSRYSGQSSVRTWRWNGAPATTLG